MKRLALFGGLAIFAGSSLTQAGLIDPDLDGILRQTAAEQTVSTLVYLADQLDTADVSAVLDAQRASLHTRHEVVVTELQSLATAMQADLLAVLEQAAAEGTVERFQAFWVGNIIRVDATPAFIRQIAQRPDVDRVYFNYPIEGVRPVDHRPGQPMAADGGVEPGVEAVRAPEAWDLGFTGEGALVATLDTGVSGSHPALQNRWRGNDPRYSGNPGWAFFDPVTGWTFPQDAGSHGTHTMGTVCGGAPGDSVGVAPGAEWIHAAVIDRVSIEQTVADSIDAFEWLIDPDGNPATSFDVPDSCSNSWGVADFHGYPDCDQTFWTFMDACEAAGIVIIFSAGNEGFGGLRRPADRATDEYRTMAVAAVDGNNPSWPVAGFSSRGPTTCTPGGSPAIKPDISAPGVQVRSSVPGGGYSSFDGTSMASPHINGVVALMRQANPEISVEQIKAIIYSTAFDLGAEGEDNDYGWGMVDAYEAVLQALSTVSLTFSFPSGRPDFIDPTGGTTIRVEVSGGMTPPEPGSGKFYYRTSAGAFTEVSMTEIEPNVYDAIFPAFACGAHVEYYFSAEAETGELVFSPFTAPDSTYSGEAYSGINVFFEDDFETDQGWTVVDSPTLTTGTWQRGVPAGGGDRGDPASDADGSGQCFVTGIADDDNDIDDGSTTLTSPNMDATEADAVLTYRRWYHNTFGAEPAADEMLVEVSDDGGATWVTLEVVGPAGPEVSGGWILKEWLVADIAGISHSDQFRIRFTASDLAGGSVVEAGIDAVQITALFCEETGIPGDVDGDGDVDFEDLLALLAAWGPCPGGGECPADFDGDDFVAFGDLLTLLAAFGS